MIRYCEHRDSDGTFCVEALGVISQKDKEIALQKKVIELMSEALRSEFYDFMTSVEDIIKEYTQKAKEQM